MKFSCEFRTNFTVILYKSYHFFDILEHTWENLLIKHWMRVVTIAFLLADCHNLWILCQIIILHCWQSDIDWLVVLRVYVLWFAVFSTLRSSWSVIMRLFRERGISFCLLIDILPWIVGPWSALILWTELPNVLLLFIIQLCTSIWVLIDSSNVIYLILKSFLLNSTLRILSTLNWGYFLPRLKGSFIKAVPHSFVVKAFRKVKALASFSTSTRIFLIYISDCAFVWLLATLSDWIERLLGLLLISLVILIFDIS